MLKLRDIMTRDLVTFAPDLSLRVAADALLDRHLHAAPVVAGRRVVGVISTQDILAFVAGAPVAASHAADDRDWASSVEETPELEELDDDAGAYFSDLWSGTDDELVERFGSDDEEEVLHDVLGEHVVGDAMTRGARALSPDATVAEAADLMRREGIHRVLVLEDGRLEGIVSALDIARAVADHRLLVRQFVFDRRR